MTKKKCTKCGEEKELEAFYIDSRSKFGRTAKCKECARAWDREYSRTEAGRAGQKRSRETEARKKYIRDYHRNRRAIDPDFRDRSNAACRKYLKTPKGQKAVAKYRSDPNNQNKIAARHAIKNAIRRGELVRPCQCQSGGKYGVACSNGKITAHHYQGYAIESWLRVEWLCPACHEVADNNQGKAQ